MSLQHLHYNGPVLLSKTTLGIETVSLLRIAGMGMDGNLKTIRHFFLRFNATPAKLPKHIMFSGK